MDMLCVGGEVKCSFLFSLPSWLEAPQYIPWAEFIWANDGFKEQCLSPTFFIFLYLFNSYFAEINHGSKNLQIYTYNAIPEGVI